MFQSLIHYLKSDLSEKHKIVVDECFLTTLTTD